MKRLESQHFMSPDTFGQRCWRTRSKHLASSSRPERLTMSDTAMGAQPPQTNWITSSSIRSETWPRLYPTRATTPETQQEPLLYTIYFFVYEHNVWNWY